ncbi:MAG: ParA family protein [Anaerolineales bacterium]|jgi:chromosome partitioning protein
MANIYALVNQKGGVGKTTTAINLGAYLAQFDQRVLIVDVDPQANATASLGINHSQIELSIYDALIADVPPGEIVMKNRKLNLSLLPSSAELAGAQVEMTQLPSREKLLERVLNSLETHYDYLLIDCPPSLGLLTLNGLVAAREGVIIPVQCEYLALEGLTQLMQTLDRVRANLFPGLSIRGMVLTMFDARTNLSRDVVEEVRHHFPGQVFQSIIPRSIRLAEAPSHGLPISTYAPDSTGALAYKGLAGELLKGDQS